LVFGSSLSNTSLPPRKRIKRRAWRVLDSDEQKTNPAQA